MISSVWITNVLKLSIMPIEMAPAPALDALEEADLKSHPCRQLGTAAR